MLYQQRDSIQIARVYSWIAASILAALLFTSAAVFADELAADPTTRVVDSRDKAQSETERNQKRNKGGEKGGTIDVPDGTPKELLDFIDKVSKNRGPGRDGFFLAGGAIIEAVVKIRKHHDATIVDEVHALEAGLPTLRILARTSNEHQRKYLALVEEISTDKRQSVKRISQLESIVIDIERLPYIDSIEVADIRFYERFREVILDQAIVRSNEIFQMLSNMTRLSSRKSDAAPLFDDLANVLEKSSDRRDKEMAIRARGTSRRLQLIGMPIHLEGQTAEGEMFDWSAYRGKVVLVDFWASWCAPCCAEFPNLKSILQKYEGDFDIVGVNMDSSIDEMRELVEREEVPWTNIVGEETLGDGRKNPIAVRYGISEIPTAILVDRDGKVLSLEAPGRRLESLLDYLIKQPGDPDDS
ncbi:TlpA family protein disulfide reductase [Neorhodopirellula lusitana]|uniref:TlpA family protein disulfide reductase n=1 Tax=Neorhodopirellula lusitana TaxID=445327 RepID=UPI00384CC159